MKCQILFSRKNKKNILKCCLLKFLPSMQSVKMSAAVVMIIALKGFKTIYIVLCFSP